MFVLTRRRGQELVIEGNIRLVVVQIHGARVQLGLAAPQSVGLDRKEVHERRLQGWPKKNGPPD
jgi:carbon storage regulator